MSPQWTRALALLAGLLLLLPCVLVLRAGWYARRALHPEKKRVTAADRAEAARLLGRLEDVELRTADGLTLRAWFVPGARRSAVVFSHGGGGNRVDLLAEAAALARHGHGVLLLDHRGSGESEGDLTTWGDQERRDLAAAVQWLVLRPDVDPARLGVLGFSVGSTTAALAAVADPRLHAVALGPIWPSLEDELEDKFPGYRAPIAKAVFRGAGVELGAVRPVDVVARLAQRPVLFFRGALDRDTPALAMERVMAALPLAERWTIAGAGHGGYAAFDAAGFEQRLATFFDRALPAPAAPPPGPAGAR